MNTRNIFNTLFAILSINLLQAQTTNILYVKAGASGGGTTWDNATNELRTALGKAKKGTEVWVAEGTYFPTSGIDREISFSVPTGVAVYGGFQGNETNKEQRNIDKHPTILSGNIGSDDQKDNTFNVVYFSQVTKETIFDGFIITGGQADAIVDYSHRKRSGGGMYIDGYKSKCNPSIANCTFIDNFAREGGAVYNNGRLGEASPTFEFCKFEQNETHFDGGAVYNDGRTDGKSNPTFDACVFSENKGNYGGAVFNYGLNGAALPKYENCQFSDNSAYVKGGAIFNIAEMEFESLTLKSCVFSNNSALDHESDDIHHYIISGEQTASN